MNVVATNNDKTMDVKNLNKYVSGSIPISKEEEQKITTALIIEEDGSSYHVPTTVYQENGKYYARVKSLSNGDFALVYNEANYSDVTGKWYEDLVNEMSSRKITDGVESEKFEGDKAITRGEFAGFLVNALGLPQRTQIQNRFEDVDATEWYTNHIATAYKYGIVKGVNASETLYGPNNTITRQEAMAMIARASQVAEFEGTSQGNVGGFTDATKVSDWALEAVGFNVVNQLIIGDNNKLRPRDSISRAESLAMMLRLLQKAELVDVRTQN